MAVIRLLTTEYQATTDDAAHVEAMPVLPGIRVADLYDGRHHGGGCDPVYDAVAVPMITLMGRRAYAKQGKRAFENTLRATCLHEAGHAVISWLDGRRATRLRVRRIKGEWCGTFEWDPDEATIAAHTTATITPTVDLIKQAREAISGVASERIFDKKDFRLGSSLDEVAAFNIISTVAGVDPRRIVASVDEDLLAHKLTVLMLAKKLEWRRTLRAPEIAAIIGRAEACQDVLEGYKREQEEA